jgi:hypothetical protein
MSLIKLFAITAMLVLLAACAGDGDAQRLENCLYLQQTLGGIVLAFQQKHGRLPTTFEEAHAESGVVLPHRGDKFGRPLVYRKISEGAFHFLSYGPNGQPEAGHGDDLLVEYQGGWLRSCEEGR